MALKSPFPRICIALGISDPNKLFEAADREAEASESFLEFRLDYLRKPASALARIKRFTDYYPHALVIATCRRAVNGGKFRGTVQAQLDLLIKAANSGCQIVDIELQTANQMKPQDFTRVRNSAALILSFHDFRGTKDLDKTFEKMRRHSADFYKVVTTAKSLLPSLLKSLTATETGNDPTAKLVAAPKLPAPVPSRIETLAELPLAAARSIPRRQRGLFLGGSEVYSYSL